MHWRSHDRLVWNLGLLRVQLEWQVAKKYWKKNPMELIEQQKKIGLNYQQKLQKLQELRGEYEQNKIELNNLYDTITKKGGIIGNRE